MKKTLLIFSLVLLLLPIISKASPADYRLRGKILLQVESHGEAWYVKPEDGKRIYMEDGDAAYRLMKNYGLGITNLDLSKIPVGFEDRFICTDSDNDGLCDKLEDGLGTNKNNPDSDGDGYNDGDEVKNNHDPLSNGKLNYDLNLANRLKGKILLQVESHGEAWYIHPDDGKRYYMPDGWSAYQIMKFLSLGITNNDLARIDIWSGDNNYETYTNSEYSFTFNHIEDDQYNDFSVKEEENKIYLCSNPGRCNQYVEIFYKDELQTLSEIIEQDILEGYSLEDCWVSPWKTEGSVERVQIAYPENDDPNGPWWENSKYCPAEYSQTNGGRYFYYDSNFPDRYAFFGVGQDPIMGADNVVWQNTFQFLDNSLSNVVINTKLKLGELECGASITCADLGFICESPKLPTCLEKGSLWPTGIEHEYSSCGCFDPNMEY